MFKQVRNETQRRTVIAGLTRKSSRFDDAKRVNPLSDRDYLQRKGWRMCLRHDGYRWMIVLPSPKKIP